MITEDDVKLIVLQCEHQKDATPEAIAGFTTAYMDAKDNMHEHEFMHGAPSIHHKILEWGKIIKPGENRFGWRNIPVLVGYAPTPEPQVVPRMMENYCEEYWWHAFYKGENHWKNADRLYKDFEEIHPFRDGNGRVGHLLWAIATRELEGEWPMALPPDLWR